MTSLSNEQLIESLNWRYATKVFDASKKIPEDQINTLIESLVLTPSSFGLQPWKFFVIADQATKDKLPEVSWGQTQPKDCSHMVVLAIEKGFAGPGVDRFIDRMADVRGVTTESLSGYRDFAGGFVDKANNEGWVDTWATHQVYIAIGQLMTSAALLGIDACPMEGISPDDYDNILGLEEKGYHSVLGCALGYRDESDKYASLPKVRYEQGDVVEVI